MSMGATDLVAPEGQKHLATEENARCHQDHPTKFPAWITVFFVFGLAYTSPFYPSEYRLSPPDFLKAGSDKFSEIIFIGYKIGEIIVTMFELLCNPFWKITTMLWMTLYTLVIT